MPESSNDTLSSLREAFASHLKTWSDAPTWWMEMKENAFERFLELPYPRRKDESWRFANVSQLSLEDAFLAQPSSSSPNELVERSSITGETSGQIVFSDNGQIDFQQASQALTDKGVLFLPIREALAKHGETLRDYFMKQDVGLGSEKFAHLHTAFLADGMLLYAPRGVEIELPFAIYHWATAANTAILPHTLIIAEEFSKISLVESHQSSDEETASRSIGVSHLFAGVGASIDYTLLQNLNEKSLGFQINSNIAGQDSKVKTLGANIGCHHYRSETHGQIRGSGAHVEMLSIAAADDTQEIDQRTLQSHFAPHATSDLLFKNALTDKAKTIFSGLIKVEEDAQQTDAYQTNRNLLLSNEAEANSLPGLEIEANDVKCSHGATTSQIDPEEIFYMLARGIDKSTAHQLIVHGFFEEILERIQDDTLAENIRALLQRKFSKGA